MSASLQFRFPASNTQDRTRATEPATTIRAIVTRHAKEARPILPWAVTLGLLFYVLHGMSFAQVKAALGAAAAWTVPVLALLVLCIYLGDSFAIWRTFGWFVTRLSLREVLVVRGATYLIALVNYTVGQAAALLVNRSRGVPLLRGTAAVLLVMGINILLLLVFASIGLLVAPDLPPVLREICSAHMARSPSIPAC